MILSKDFLKQVKIVDLCQQIRFAQTSAAAEIPFSLKVNMYRNINDSLDDWQPFRMDNNFVSNSLICK
jgi:hypothetical protein